ncbi:MAG: NAD(+) synthase [Desulfobacterales bacterium]|nr:MAG: NAD(+) synthase [Desulfobacterales bacterium]
MNRIKLPGMDCEKVCRQIGDFVIDAVLGIHYTGCVIGLSGGVDSSTAAALIKRAFDRYNLQGAQKLELVGYILPSSINREDDIKDAEAIVKKLGIRHEIHSIERLVEACRTTNPEAFQDNYHKGNLISRVRANVLSTKAATEKKILAGTGNKDEDFGIGYYTLFGDGAVHISPIGGLSKRLVREMALFLGFEASTVYRRPTAGLEPGQSDFKDLGYDYDLVELVTEAVQQGFSCKQLVTHEQVAPLIEQQMGQYRSVFGKTKFESAEQLLDDIARRHHIAREKVKIIHPPTPKITLFYQ